MVRKIGSTIALPSECSLGANKTPSYFLPQHRLHSKYLNNKKKVCLKKPEKKENKLKDEHISLLTFALSNTKWFTRSTSM